MPVKILTSSISAGRVLLFNLPPRISTGVFGPIVNKRDIAFIFQNRFERMTNFRAPNRCDSEFSSLTFSKIQRGAPTLVDRLMFMIASVLPQKLRGAYVEKLISRTLFKVRLMFVLAYQATARNR